MSLPPQLVGIKRRRHDEPVDVLCKDLAYVHHFAANQKYTDLEQDRPSNKRRFTDFVFQRLRPNELTQLLPPKHPSCSSQIQERVRSASNYATGAAPVVQATSPGAELRDALQRRAARAQLLQQQNANLSSGDSGLPALTENVPGHDTDAESVRHKRLAAARRFHLSPSNLTLAPSKQPGGIRKHKTHTRSHLATFVERHVDRFNDGQLHASNHSFAIDRLIDDAKFSPQPALVQNDASAFVGYSPKRIRPFVKAPRALAKTGNSIKDHPSTWDHDSDQLADELAAFALEISGGDQAQKRDERQVETLGRRTPEIGDADVDMDDLYVYETYLRIPRSELSPSHEGKMNRIGMLVIEEQDEELWQTFAEDEEDSEWDEEDADSNGMCIAQLTFDF